MRTGKVSLTLLVFFILSHVVFLFALQSESKPDRILNVNSYDDRLMGIHDGNSVRTLFYNFGTIGKPNTEPSFKWPKDSDNGYGFEFGILIGAKVKTESSKIYCIFSEHVDDGDSSPLGQCWGWEPLPEYAAGEPNNSIAMSDDPSSWPENWNSWYGINGFGDPIADQESFWVMDDYYNKEFNRTDFNYPSEAEDPNGDYIYHSDIKENYYYPDTTDYERGGLGLEVVCRGLQWNNKDTQDILFFTYDIKNVGTKKLENLVFGLYGDPHSGGANDYGDDCISMVNSNGLDIITHEIYPNLNNAFYIWDFDTLGYGGFQPGIFGCRILGDSTYNSIQSINTVGYHMIYAYEDERMWEIFTPGYIDTSDWNNTDNVVLFGSGYFSLNPSEVKTQTIAFIFGYDKKDFIDNARAAEEMYWKKLNPEASLPEITLTSPVHGESVSGNHDIKWETQSDTGNQLKIDLFYNTNQGTGWQLIVENKDDNGIFSWNTISCPDGFNYQVAVVVKDNLLRNVLISDYFVVNNTGQTANPEVLLLYPVYEQSLSETVDISWRGGDADSDESTIKVLLSNNDGDIWKTLTETQIHEGKFNWDTKKHANGYYTLRLEITDGTIVRQSRTSLEFHLYNKFLMVPDSTLLHVTGNGTGRVGIHVVDSTKLLKHEYQITFDDTSNSYKTYCVYDLNKNIIKVQNDQVLSSDYSGELFDGMRLVFNDYTSVSVNTENSGWMSGDCNLNYTIGKYSSPYNIYFPCDYILEFADTFISTSYNSQIPINVKCLNITDSSDVDLVVFEYNKDGYLSNNEGICITQYVDERLVGQWILSLKAPDVLDTIPPGDGDVFQIITNKPFTYKDTIIFTPNIEDLNIENETDNLPDRYRLYQNYPNPFNPTTIIKYEIPESDFITLNIYNLLGQNIKTLVHERQLQGAYSVIWDGKDSAGKNLSSGVYLYHLYSKDYSKIYKMVLMK